MRTSTLLLRAALIVALGLTACGRDYSGPSAVVEGDDTGADFGGEDSTNPDPDTDRPDVGGPDVITPDTTPPDVGPMPDVPPDPDVGPEDFVLQVTPSQSDIIVGETARFRAFLVGETSTEDVTAESDWFVEGRGAEVVAPGRVLTQAPGEWVVIAQFRGQEAEAFLSARGASENLVAIAVQPESLEIPVGFDGRVTATGLYDNGSSRDLTEVVTWTSEASRVFTVGNGDRAGIVSGVSAGNGSVVAELDGVRGAGFVTVVGVELESIEIVPRTVTIPEGDSAQLQALGQFSNGDIVDVTAQVTWSSADTNIAAFSRGTPGEVAGANGGTVTVTASLDGVEGQGTVTVTEAEVVQLSIIPPVVETPAGGNLRLRASAVLSDDAAIDVTNEALWVSDDGQVAQIRQIGDTIQLEAISAGVTTVRATYGGVTATASITVTPAVLESLSVTPQVLSLPAGNTRQLILVGTYSDASRTNLTFQADWTTSNGDAAIVGNRDQAGFLTARAPGRTTITATYDNRSIDIEVTVTDAELVAIQIQPPRASVPAGDQIAMSCFGVYSDNSLRGLTEDATWTSLSPGTAAVSNAPGERGTVTGVETGDAIIRIRFDGFEDEGVVEVTEEVVTDVFVTPGQGLIVAGRAQNFNAFAVYSNGGTQVVTQEAVWTSNRSAVAQVSNADGQRGRVSGLEPGQATITAAFGGQTGQANVRVSDAVLENIAIFPERIQLSPGTSVQAFALGLYSNRNVRQNLTWEVLWSSEDEGIATVSNIPQSPGIITGVRPGETVISAEVDGVRAEVRIVVVDREVIGLTISPPSAILPVDAFQLFTALAEYDDGTTQDVTQNTTWGSTDAGVIAALQFRPGLTNTVSEGEATVTAEFDGFTARSEVVVREAEPTNVVISPVNPILRRQGQQPAQIAFYATAIYPDNTTSDVTQLCSWTSSNTGSILIFDELGAKGFAFGLQAGSSEITARCGEFTATTVATVR